MILGTDPRRAQSGDNSFTIYQKIHGTGRAGMNIIPSHNNLFNYYVDKIIDEFARLIIKTPKDKKIGCIINYLFQN